MTKTKRNITPGLTVPMTISVLTLAILPSVVLAQAYEKVPEPHKIYSPYVERTKSDANFAEGVYFGDTGAVTELNREIYKRFE